MEYNIWFNTDTLKIKSNPLSFICDNHIDDWKYSVKLDDKWFNVIIVNNSIKFNDNIFDRVWDKINSEVKKNYSNYYATLCISSDELFILNKIKSLNSSLGSSSVVPIVVDDDLDDKLKHYDEEIKMLKTKNAILENKLKFYENEIKLIKDSLGL